MNIFTTFHKDWTKIVDYLLTVKVLANQFFFETPFRRIKEKSGSALDYLCYKTFNMIILSPEDSSSISRKA